MEKEYMLGQLEKKLADKDYYLRSPINTKKRVADEMSILIERLQSVKLEKKEKRLFFRSLNFVERIRSVIK